jgi:hypothetical protein
VIGGGCGIVMPLIPRLGFGFLAGVLLVVVFLVVRMKPSSRPVAGPRNPRPGPGGPRPEAQRPTSTSRTILTTSVAEQRANRAKYDEPTVELKVDPQEPEQPADRWWSGQSDEDTVEDEAPWAKEPTVERDRGLFGRRRSGGDTPRRPTN